MANQNGGFETSGFGGGLAETEGSRRVTGLVGCNGCFNVGLSLNGRRRRNVGEGRV